MTIETIRNEVAAIFDRVGLASVPQGDLTVSTPLIGGQIFSVQSDSVESMAAMLTRSHVAQKSWAAVDSAARGSFLKSLAGKISDHAADLSKLVHYDSGKSLRESAIEITSIIGLINGTIKDASYEPLASGAERAKEFTPLGVIAIVSPFNFPLAISLWTGVPALLAGNTVINKPSEKALLASMLFAAVFKGTIEDFNAHTGKKTIPEDIFQVAVGGPAVGRLLVGDSRVAKVVFTGGIDGCEKIKKADEAVHRRTKALTEGGAANFAVVSDKHHGMTRQSYVEFVVGAIMKSLLPYAGQKCINTRQIFVHDSIAKAVVDEFENQLGTFKNTWRVENVFDEENPYEFTPLIDERAGERFEWALQQAKNQGATLTGGERRGGEEYARAQYFMPAIAVFDQIVPLMSEEIFGPFLMIVPYTGGVENALAMAQKPNANLVNAYYGSDEQEAKIFKRRSTSGFALINPPLGTGLLPLYGLGFGGNELSGQGESLSREPLLAFIEPEGPIKRNVTFKLPFPDGK